MLEKISFVSLEAYDAPTGYVVYELYLELFDQSELPEYVQEKVRKVGPDQSERVDRVRLIESSVLHAEIAGWGELPLRLRHESCALPYRLHGGRELDLMMKSVKPLSVFSYLERGSSLADFISVYFEPLVESGKLISAVESHGSDPASTLMFALPKEAWRIAAYRLVTATARATKWNDALERMQGALLGYTFEQCDCWMSYRSRMGLRWGLQSVYRFLSPIEADFVRNTGRKAFRLEDNSIRLYLPHESPHQTDPIAALAGGSTNVFGKILRSDDQVDPVRSRGGHPFRGCV